jgi:Ca-activated chloride channel family protein
VDVVFVLDSSLSMAALDVPPSRLFTAKSLIRRFLEAAPQNRVALVQAEGAGEVLTPLTVDGSVIDLLLDTVQPGSLPQPGTALAVALETGLGLFLEGDTRHRVMVVISDGEDHGGGLGKITERLVEAGVVTHTLGLGTPSGAPLPIPGGERGEMKRDEEGRVVISRLDEEVLETLARATGGLYLRVTSPAVDLGPMLRRLDEMSTQTLETETVEVLEERFQWPTAAAAATLALYLGLGPFRRLPPHSGPGDAGEARP